MEAATAFLFRLRLDLVREAHGSSHRSLRSFCPEVSLAELFNDSHIPASSPVQQSMFSKIWNDTVGSLPVEGCVENAVQEQFRVCFTRFLSATNNLHVVDCSRSGLYGVQAKVDLLFYPGPTARQVPTYFDACIVCELKASGKSDEADMKLVGKAIRQVMDRMQNIVAECGTRRRSYWSFVCSRTVVVFVHLRVLFHELSGQWSYVIRQSAPVALEAGGGTAICDLLSHDPLALCEWEGAPPPAVSDACSANLLSQNLPIGQSIKLKGMLQRGPEGHGVVEVALGNMCHDQEEAEEVVCKFFPKSKRELFAHERDALNKLSVLHGDSLYGEDVHVPILKFAQESDAGCMLCTAPLGTPLLLASCFETTMTRYCKELFAQLVSVVAKCHAQQLYHNDICPQNVVLVRQPSDAGFALSISLIDWGAASFWGNSSDIFHFHTAFSPDWVSSLSSTAAQNMDPAEQLQLALQQILLTTLFVAFGDVLSWVPPVAVSMDGEGHKRLKTATDMYKYRSNVIHRVVHSSDSLSLSPALQERYALVCFFRELYNRFSGLFDMQKRSHADPADLDRMVAFCMEDV